MLATDAANFRKDNAFYQEVRDTFGNGLLTSQDDDAAAERFLQPLFTRRRVVGYAAAMATDRGHGRRHWRARADGVVDVHDEMTR